MRNLEELPDEELLKEAQRRKTLLSIIGGLIGVMLVSGIIRTVGEGIGVFTFLPFAFLGMAGIYWSNYNKVKKEIEAREL